MPRFSVLALGSVFAFVFSLWAAVSAIGANPRENWWHCAFVDPACSTAISTYLLAAFAFLAFMAAIEAGVFAKRAADAAQKTLDYERAPLLAIEECVASQCDGRGQPPLLISDLAKGFEDAAGLRSEEYSTLVLDAHNIGRSALTNVVAYIDCKMKDGTKSRLFTVRLGSIAAGARRHFSLYADRTLILSATFDWARAECGIPRLADETSRAANAVQFFPTQKNLGFGKSFRWAEGQNKTPQPEFPPLTPPEPT